MACYVLVATLVFVVELLKPFLLVRGHCESSTPAVAAMPSGGGGDYRCEGEWVRGVFVVVVTE